MDLKTLVQRLGEQLKLPQLALNENNVCFLTFDNRIQVGIEGAPEPDVFFLYTILCPIPQEKKHELYESLMEAHLFGIGTRGGTFAASQQFGHVFFFKRFDLRDISFESFLRELETFVQAYDFWQKKLGLPEFKPVETPTTS